MNLCLAVFLVWLHFVSGVELESYVKQPAVIGRIDASSPAAKAGIQPKDRIMAVNGKLTPSWREAQLAIARNPNRTLSLTIDRAGRRLSVETTPAADKELGVGTLGIGPSLPFVVGSVEPGSPAAQADLRPGDRLLEVIGRNRTAYEAGDVTELIGASRGQSLRFRIDRRGRTIEKTIAPVQMREGVRIGIARQVFTVTEKYGPVEAIGKSLEHNYRVTTLTFGVLGRIITGKTSLRTMSGPIEIARYSGMAAREGAVALMSLMALISLQLGIFNLLPIPILDGGVIALLLVEGLMRRDLSMKVKERIFQVGFIFLVLLMGIIIFNDISKHFSHL
jgi:regulator of sigma E protease